MGRIRCDICKEEKPQVGLGDLGKWECLECYCKRKGINIYYGRWPKERNVDFSFSEWNMNRLLKGLE
ncbi:MAG: hypothetical protein [Lokiarchaeia virus VerdaV1]|uniref:Uncharacterized protein n=1 Tax=Lokiarchaeia virus VerdaV1 TaxID=3070170 RepID=A0AA35CNE1_9CAUD|nr:MAG: hypothetical protein QIT41_gp36 [Lokiarchaeia virus VerdaV1]BDI54885.1 MAG: hypothetical protein [Lokiarchaeia virus VerdaV1]